MKAPNSIDVGVGEQIRMRRKSMGITQMSLGQQVGITFQQIQKYESGKNRVGASRLQAIASALGVDVAYLFAPVPYDDPKKNASSGNMDAMRAFFGSSEGHALNRAFSRIKNADVRRGIVALVASIAAESKSEIPNSSVSEDQNVD
ncbi:helix-turn-helix domain-containing protein [Agrobacterium sp. rho-13.3]|uniref:helix-turn-helix domain-containing protein n=1 Tax=Agrobacterium sp. rho-13.3 TaxID=3072980 RepID=UPI002A13BB00|nr:helix-turn-helix transcriptional regulator [Agrobacterium sp. rho-13.3]MDX8309172.1 helix-turn-helix transcriptional regulator [Agrobacterium sp. rho-13.3]